MGPLDSPNRRVSVILASFTIGAVGSGEEPDEDRVRSLLLSSSAVPEGTKAGREAIHSGDLSRQSS